MKTNSCDGGWTSGGVVARDFVHEQQGFSPPVRARWPEGTLGGIAPQARTGPKSIPSQRLIYYMS